MTGYEQALASSKTLRTRGLGPRANKQEDSDNLKRRQELDDRTGALLEHLHGQERAILANKRLSDLGRTERVRELAQSEAKEFGYLGREFTKTREVMNRLKALCLDYRIVPKDADKQVEYLRGWEVRQDFRHRPQHEREGAFFSAAERLDGEYMRAFLTGPGLPLVTGDIVGRAEEAYGQRRNPEAWDTLQRTSQYHEYVLGLARIVAWALTSYVVPPADIEKALQTPLVELGIEPAKQPLPQLVTDKDAARG